MTSSCIGREINLIPSIDSLRGNYTHLYDSAVGKRLWTNPVDIPSDLRWTDLLSKATKDHYTEYLQLNTKPLTEYVESLTKGDYS